MNVYWIITNSFNSTSQPSCSFRDLNLGVKTFHRTSSLCLQVLFLILASTKQILLLLCR